MTTVSAHLLDPDKLRALADDLARREDRDDHWSVRAILIGRVQDEGLFRLPAFQRDPLHPYTTARAWALDVLDTPPSQFRPIAERLWPMMRDHQTKIGWDEWRRISKGRAWTLSKILALPDTDPRQWFEAAATIKSPALFERELAAKFKEPVWTVLRIPMPVTMDDVVTRAFTLALPRVLGSPHPDPERIKDRDVKFRLLERLCVFYAEHESLDRDDAPPPLVAREIDGAADFGDVARAITEYIEASRTWPLTASARAVRDEMLAHLDTITGKANAHAPLAAPSKRDAHEAHADAPGPPAPRGARA